MTPNAGDFEVISVGDGTCWLWCPTCDNRVYSSDGYAITIRDLIGAASEHARLAHPVSVPAANVRA